MVPDLRGQFIRGADSARTPLTTQAQSTARPVNPFTGTTSTDGWHDHGISPRRAGAAGGSGVNPYNPGGTFADAPMRVDANGNHAHNVVISGGGDTETRPANFSLVFYIRATI